MDIIYKLLKDLRDFIVAGEHTNKVTFGEFEMFDLDKANIYPLVHINIKDAAIKESTIEFTLKILAADILDQSPDYADDDIFFGNDNLQDVLNTQLQVFNRLFSQLRRGEVGTTVFRTLQEVIAEPFIDEFDNRLAGWMSEVVIVVPNTFGVC